MNLLHMKRKQKCREGRKRRLKQMRKELLNIMQMYQVPRGTSSSTTNMYKYIYEGIQEIQIGRDKVVGIKKN